MRASSAARLPRARAPQATQAAPRLASPARAHRWDYGYQTTAMANRTVIVDNNTWNNTHIATVGLAMSSPEEKAWQIYRSLDVNYVFVVFGGFIGPTGWERAPSSALLLLQRCGLLHTHERVAARHLDQFASARHCM